MKRRTRMLLIGAYVAIATAGCDGQAREAKWDNDSAQYAQYATQIPLYPGTKIVSAMGSESWGDEADSYSYGMCWWCETKATKDELLAWYGSRLQNAERTNLPDDDNLIQFKVNPQGAQSGEDMGVWIEEDGKYRIFENRKKKEFRS